MYYLFANSVLRAEDTRPLKMTDLGQIKSKIFHATSGLAQSGRFSKVSVRAVNSAGECHPHTVEVAGSNPAPPTTWPEAFENRKIHPRSSRIFRSGTSGGKPSP